jgi:superfamily II DNA/RNA helicase
MEGNLKISKWKQVEMPIDKAMVTHLRKQLGFSKITKVQREVIPLFAKHKDVCVKAWTGSGKTLAYLISMLQLLINDEVNAENVPKGQEVVSLILVPARELAIQVSTVLLSLLPLFPFLSSYCCIGGKKISEDIEEYKQKGGNIVIGTVGRVWDFIERGVVKLKGVRWLIIDEADLFFEQGNQVSFHF